MSVIYLLLAASLLVALVFLYLFIRSVREGQYDDTWSPSRRMLIDDEPVEKKGPGDAEGSAPGPVRDDVTSKGEGRKPTDE